MTNRRVALPASILGIFLCSVSCGCGFRFPPEPWDMVPRGYTGVWRTYYPSGRIESELNWRNGRRHGRTTFWRKNRHVSMTATFKHGRLHGKRTGWDPNGEKGSEVVYVEGKKEGRELGWNGPGKPAIDGIWRGGKPWQGVLSGPHVFGGERFFKDGVERKVRRSVDEALMWMVWGEVWRETTPREVESKDWARRRRPSGQWTWTWDEDEKAWIQGTPKDGVRRQQPWPPALSTVREGGREALRRMSIEADPYFNDTIPNLQQASHVLFWRWSPGSHPETDDGIIGLVWEGGDGPQWFFGIIR